MYFHKSKALCDTVPRADWKLPISYDTAERGQQNLLAALMSGYKIQIRQGLSRTIVPDRTRGFPEILRRMIGSKYMKHQRWYDRVSAAPQ